MKNPKYNWRQAVLGPDRSIKDAISSLNKTNLQIVLIQKKQKFLGTLTDGDIRRAIVSGKSINEKINRIMNSSAIFVRQHVSYESAKEIMKERDILQIPILDKKNKLVGLYTWNKDMNLKKRNNLVIIMAGGYGRRMKKMTSLTPKPMIDLYGKPILEHIINNLRNCGFKNIIITTHYLEHKIRKYFKDGKKFNVKIKYVQEKNPLGTAGSLSKIYTRAQKPVLVTNGDVLTNVNYSEILNFHKSNQADATMGVRVINIKHTFGVVDSNGLQIKRIEEKPTIKNYINAGVYVLSKKTIKLIPKNTFLNMTDLFNKAVTNNQKAILFPLYENWQDFAKPRDLKVSKKKFKI